MSEPPPAAARARARWAGLCGLLLLASCGEPTAAPPATSPVAAGARWAVEPVPPLQKARFALDRVVRGPLAQQHLPLPDDHPWVLTSALRDLVALPAETLSLLDDPALLGQLTGPERQDLNPWHNVLQVLPALSGAEAALVRRWTEPALSRPEASLWQMAVGCLAGRPEPELAPVLHALLQRAAGDRRVARDAARALMQRPAPWPLQGVQAVLAHAAPEAWLACGESPAAAPAYPGGVPAVMDALAWWVLLAGQAGPRPAAQAPRLKSLPCTEALADAQGAPWRRSGEAQDARGWLAADPSACAVQGLPSLFTTGLEPVSAATCELARLRLPAFRHAVEQARSSRDALRHLQAQHCMLDEGGDLATAVRIERTLAFLQRATDPASPRLDLAGVREAIAALPSGEDPQGEACLVRVVREGAPVADLQLLVEGAHTALLAADKGADDRLVLDLLASGDATLRGIGLHLAQRARKPQYLPAVRRLATPGDEAAARAVQRVIFTLATAPGASEAERATTVAETVARMEAGSDAAVANEAPGLLALGSAGHAALAALVLRSPRAPLYVRSLRRVEGVFPLAVAEALCDRLAPAQPPGLRYDIAVALWRNAPSEAAAALAAARARVEPEGRPALDVVLEMVRHRAAFARE